MRFFGNEKNNNFEILSIVSKETQYLNSKSMQNNFFDLKCHGVSRKTVHYSEIGLHDVYSRK